MKRMQHWFWVAGGLTLAVSALCAAEKHVTFPNAGTTPRPAVIESENTPPRNVSPDGFRASSVDLPPTTPLAGPKPADGWYWLGVRVQPAGTALRSQLHLGGTGLVVLDVIAGTPAHEAGFLRDDVLLEAGATSRMTALHTRLDMTNAVNSAAESHDPVTVRFLRNGEDQTITVTPVLRPVPLYGTHVRHRPSDLVDDFVIGEALVPVVMMPAGSASLVTRPLPENMTITVTRAGSQPAQIVVQRDHDRWNVTEAEIDTLPGDVRPYVIRELRTAATPRIAAPVTPPVLR